MQAGDGGTGPADPPFTEVVCRSLGDGPACTVEGSGGGLAFRGDVLTAAREYRGGEVLVAPDGTIVCAGCDCDAPVDVRRVTCPGAVIAPAFVNPHDHVAYVHQAPRPGTVERFEHRHDWRLGLREHTAIDYEGGASPAARAAHELRMLMDGVTALAGGAGHAGLVRNLDVADLDEGARVAPADSDTFPLDDADGLLVASGCGYGGGRTQPSDVERFGAYLPHLGEGIDAEAHNEIVCALEPSLVGETTGVVHAVALDATLARVLALRRALVVWSPRSNLSLYGNTAPVTLLRRSGVEIALGTDWLLSGSMNVRRELACARSFSDRYLDGELDARALYRMATASAARAVGAEAALGSIARGHFADLQIVRRRGQEAHAAVVEAGPEDVELVVRGGVPLYGDRAVVDALGDGCDALDVCGSEKAVCLAETGRTLDELVAASPYPLASCDSPPNEPTCVPSRPGEYDGVPNAADADGDGIADDLDACPAIFDPPRPLDGSRQADADGDAIGDACDPCPLDARSDCAARPADDLDADGVDDASDRCPRRADASQADGDRDGTGDACDTCSVENPGVVPCPLTLAALRDPASPTRPPRHALILVHSARVGAVRPDTGNARGFVVSDGIAPFSGIFVFTGKRPPGVLLGEELEVAGRLDVYQGSDELVAARILERAPGGAVEPVVVTASDVGDGGALSEAYEAMLVRVENVAVTNENPDAPADYDELLLDGLLRVDDLFAPALDNDVPRGARFRSITGVLGRSFGHPKLWPRAASDLVAE
jgi:cytosine/adenosine deaminase-related metal-dependent hydrolase